MWWWTAGRCGGRGSGTRPGAPGRRAGTRGKGSPEWRADKRALHPHPHLAAVDHVNVLHHRVGGLRRCEGHKAKAARPAGLAVAHDDLGGGKLRPGGITNPKGPRKDLGHAPVRAERPEGASWGGHGRCGQTSGGGGGWPPPHYGGAARQETRPCWQRCCSYCATPGIADQRAWRQHRRPEKATLAQRGCPAARPALTASTMLPYLEKWSRSFSAARRGGAGRVKASGQSRRGAHPARGQRPHAPSVVSQDSPPRNSLAEEGLQGVGRAGIDEWGSDACAPPSTRCRALTWSCRSSEPPLETCPRSFFSCLGGQQEGQRDLPSTAHQP